MKRLLCVSFALLMCLAAVSAQPTDPTTGSVEKRFAPAGEVRMTLSAGDYRITGTADPAIRIDWNVRYPEEARDVHVDADVQGTRARITTDGPSNHFRVRIRVPARSDLYVRLTAGDMDVEGVNGNKDIESHAGDLTIDMGSAENYKQVDASVWAGDLEIRPLRVSKGGLFRSYRWDGNGPYRLHAHLKAGDLRIR